MNPSRLSENSKLFAFHIFAKADYFPAHASVSINKYGAMGHGMRAGSLSDLGNYQEKSPDLAIFTPIFR
jgi:hypothetical protein